MKGYTDKFIFLPAAGCKYTDLEKVNVGCCYWTATRTNENNLLSHINTSFPAEENDVFMCERKRCFLILT